MKPIFAVLFFLFSLTAQAQTHCTSQEETLFSCSTAGKKVISVCARNGLVEYRFGLAGKPEMLVPLQQKREKTDAGAFLTVNGGTGGFLRFRKSDYAYVVYWSLTRGAWQKDGTRDWVYQAGVVAEQKGKKLANVKCGKQAADDSITREELEKQLGFPPNEDMEGFDFP